MELPEQPASEPLPPSRDIHADADVQAEEKPTVRLPVPTEEDVCRNIHCACHHSWIL